MKEIINKFDEDITSTTSIKRLPRAISLNEIGGIKISYFLITWSLILFSSLYFYSFFTENYFPAFNFKINIGTEISSYVFFSLVIVFLLLVSFITAILFKTPNISFTSIYYFSKPMKSVDITLLLFFLLLFIPNILKANYYWYQILLGAIFIFLILSNLLLPKILSFYSYKSQKEEENNFEDEDKEEEIVVDQRSSIVCDYNWSSKTGEVFQIKDFKISKEKYDKYRKSNRDELDKNDGHYPFSTGYNFITEKVINGLSDDVKRLAKKIDSFTKGKSVFNKLDILLQFVHKPNFNYKYDIDSTGYNEYARYPLETLVDRVGDCECLSILAVTIFKLNGFNSALIIVKGEENLHCVAGVEMPQNIFIKGSWAEKNGIKYLYCEATGSGWVVGESPNVKPEDILLV